MNECVNALFVQSSPIHYIHWVSELIPHIANCLRWKRFVDGNVSFNLLENFYSFIQLITDKKLCSCAFTNTMCT